VTEATMKTHVTAILKALKVSSRIEAVIAVGQLGWKLHCKEIAPQRPKNRQIRSLERAQSSSPFNSF